MAIGLFRHKLAPNDNEIDFFVLGFTNTASECIEFIIKRGIELMKRLSKENRISIDNQVIEIVFWLMPDKSIYDGTDFDIGRMVLHIETSTRQNG